jgi:hypothetical protein
MSAKIQFGLAIFVVILVLMNPIGACASVAVPSSPAHPCCPKTPAPQSPCQTTLCICVDIPPAPAAVPPNVTPPLLAAAHGASAEAGLPTAVERPTFVPNFEAPTDRYLTFHQLLL